ncbi:MAG: hypothetical protein LBM69_09835 [Lachnospiraceae bacterium]|nr:hypothetical protein [Lachnospiraceae bacterium]
MNNISRMLRYSVLILFIAMVIVFPINAVTVDAVSDGDPAPAVSDGDGAPTGSGEEEAPAVSGNDEDPNMPITPGEDEGEPDEVNPNDSESMLVDSTTAEPTEPDPTIVSLIVPENLDFKIDPYNIAGRGQIYSDGKMVQNKGNSDILITFTGFEVLFSNDTQFDPLTEPFDMPFEEAQKYERKAIYITLDFGRADTEPIVITGWDGEQPTVLLTTEESDAQNSFLNLTVGGNLNPGPLNSWKDGDVRIRITYQIEPLYSEILAVDPVETISTPAAP